MSTSIKNSNPEQIITDLLNDTIDNENYNIIVCCDDTATLFDIFMKEDDGTINGGRYNKDATPLETNTFQDMHEVLLSTITNIHDKEPMDKDEEYNEDGDDDGDEDGDEEDSEDTKPNTFRYSYVYINKNGDVGEDGLLLIFDNKYMNKFTYRQTNTLFIPVVIAPVQNQQIQFDHVLSKIDTNGLQGDEKNMVERLFTFFHPN